MSNKPEAVFVNNTKIFEAGSQTDEGWKWEPLEKGGLLTIWHLNGNEVTVSGNITF